MVPPRADVERFKPEVWFLPLPGGKSFGEKPVILSGFGSGPRPRRIRVYCGLARGCCERGCGLGGALPGFVMVGLGAHFQSGCQLSKLVMNERDDELSNREAGDLDRQIRDQLPAD